MPASVNCAWGVLPAVVCGQERRGRRRSNLGPELEAAVGRRDGVCPMFVTTIRWVLIGMLGCFQFFFSCHRPASQRSDRAAAWTVSLSGRRPLSRARPDPPAPLAPAYPHPCADREMVCWRLDDGDQGGLFERAISSLVSRSPPTVFFTVVSIVSSPAESRSLLSCRPHLTGRFHARSRACSSRRPARTASAAALRTGPPGGGRERTTWS